MQRVWRALKESKASAALTKVQDDVVPPTDEPGRNDTNASPSDKTTRGSLRSCARSGKSWSSRWRTLQRARHVLRHGVKSLCPVGQNWRESTEEFSNWQLRKELTWSIFMEALHAMPSGKAVGEGGFSASLLRAASGEVQQLVYQAIIADLTEGKVSKH